MFEIDQVIYECEPVLAMLLSKLSQTKQRIRAHYWMLRPYEGYVHRSEYPEYLHTKAIYRPLLVWHRTAYRGRRVDEAILERIEFSNRADGGVLWDRQGYYASLGDYRLVSAPEGGFTSLCGDDPVTSVLVPA